MVMVPAGEPCCHEGQLLKAWGEPEEEFSKAGMKQKQRLPVSLLQLRLVWKLPAGVILQEMTLKDSDLKYLMIKQARLSR